MEAPDLISAESPKGTTVEVSPSGSKWMVVEISQNRDDVSRVEATLTFWSKDGSSTTEVYDLNKLDMTALWVDMVKAVRDFK